MSEDGLNVRDSANRGTNQTGVRQYNERLVLSIIRRQGAMPKAAIARETKLTAQTISVIISQLEREGLVVRQAPIRGRVGQPSIPITLNPDGAYSLGVKVGRRSFDLLLIDLAGTVRGMLRESFLYPTPEALVSFLREGIGILVDRMTPEQRARISGLGVATPYELWGWDGKINAPPGVMQSWRDFDIGGSLAEFWEGPIYICNNATAACAAEMLFGNPEHHRDFFYVYIGAFVGGGVVLDGKLFGGPHGNAGAIGSIPIARRPGRPALQLIDFASKISLEAMLIAANRSAESLWKAEDKWADMQPLLDDWIEQAADGLAHAIVSATCVIDFSSVIIDGAMPVWVREQIVSRTVAHLEAFDRQGLSPVTIMKGTIGSSARALGAASLPLLAAFALNSTVILKQDEAPSLATKY